MLWNKKWYEGVLDITVIGIMGIGVVQGTKYQSALIFLKEAPLSTIHECYTTSYLRKREVSGIVDHGMAVMDRERNKIDYLIELDSGEPVLIRTEKPLKFNKGQRVNLTLENCLNVALAIHNKELIGLPLYEFKP